ncbi:hypothetical protein AGMMS49992_33120 [Clostridia bacterium]|nr:hypothetical protein AGMMS49992_33120 [Clostridia bacterium]
MTFEQADRLLDLLKSINSHVSYISWQLVPIVAAALIWFVLESRHMRYKPRPGKSWVDRHNRYLIQVMENGE